MNRVTPVALRSADTDGGGARLALAGGGEQHFALHRAAGGWTLLALDLDETEPRAVVEQVGRAGELRLLGPRGIVRSYPTTLARSHDETYRYAGGRIGEVAFAPGDPLRTELLALGRDVTADDVAPLLAPIGRLADGEAERPHTFVGTPTSADVVPLYFEPGRAGNRVNPLVVAPAIAQAIAAHRISEGLIGGWLPVVRFSYALDDGTTWEYAVFADMTRGRDDSQPCWYRFLHLRDGDVLDAHYYDTYLPYPVGEEASSTAFYRALEATACAWEQRLPQAMTVELPEPWIADFVRHSFAREQITRHGDFPHYGIVDRIYGSREHDGFQDTLNAAVLAYLEWGQLDVARRYLDNYFTHFVRPDGSLDYRGPEIGQYAQMLALLARHYRYSGDLTLIEHHLPKVLAICDILLDRQAAARALPAGDPAYGLVTGRHEADISFDTPSLGYLDYERPFFSNSSQAWRGLRDLGRVFAETGLTDAAGHAGRMAQAADELARDLPTAIERSWGTYDGVEALPLFPAADLFYRHRPERSCPEAYDPHRVWGELLQGGLPDAATARRIVDFLVAYGDTMLCIPGNRKLAVVFTAFFTAYGLVQHDMIREFLILYYSMALHMHTRGTWTALECADPDRGRAEHWPYVAPAQVSMAILTKWMLVFEDPHRDRLCLLRAVPEHWFASAAPIVVEDAPTSWGAVSLRVEPDLAQGRVVISGNLPAGPEVTLRLRLPDGLSISAVRGAGGCSAVGVSVDVDTVNLGPAATARAIALEVVVSGQPTTR